MVRGLRQHSASTSIEPLPARKKIRWNYWCVMLTSSDTLCAGERHALCGVWSFAVPFIVFCDEVKYTGSLADG